MCLFEIATKDFIDEITKDKLDKEHPSKRDSRPGLVRSRRVPVKYATASTLNLEHASVVSHKIVRWMASTDIEKKDLIYDGTSRFIDDVQEVSIPFGEVEQEFHLNLAEAVAVHHRNVATLETAVTALYRKERSPAYWVRAVKMIESFCSRVASSNRSSRIASPALRMEDERMMDRIFSLVKGLATGTFGDTSICRSFARICTSFENCSNYGTMKFLAKLLLRSIVCDSHSLSEIGLRGLGRDLGSVIGRIGWELGPLELLLSIHFSSHGEEDWNEFGSNALYYSPSSPTLSVKLYSIGAHELSLCSCLEGLAHIFQYGFKNNPPQPARAVEFYDRIIPIGDESAMTAIWILAHLREMGVEGVDVDLDRVVKHLEWKIDEEGDVGAMMDFADLLKDGVEGLGANPEKAMQLYERAIDDQGDGYVIDRFLDFLRVNAEGMVVDFPGVIKLYERAIDRNGDFIAMIHLANLLTHGAAGLDPDVARAVELLERMIAKEGRYYSMMNLADILQAGAENVPADPGRALERYERALDKREAHCGHSGDEMGRFARFLLDAGEGHRARAVQMYERAVDEGWDFEFVQINFVRILQDATGVWDADPAEAARLYEHVIDKAGCAWAMYYLGDMLEDGAEGVNSDPTRAAELYERFIHGGIDAGCELARILEHGALGVSPDPALAMELYTRHIFEDGENSGKGNGTSCVLQLLVCHLTGLEHCG